MVGAPASILGNLSQRDCELQSAHSRSAMNSAWRFGRQALLSSAGGQTDTVGNPAGLQGAGVEKGIKNGSRAGGNQDDALPGTQRVMERLVNIVQRILGRNVPQRGAGLKEMTEVIRVKLLMGPRVFVENQQRFVLVLDRGFPHQQHVRVVAG